MVDKEKANRTSFAKEQFLNSRSRSGSERDLLSVVLEEGKTYKLAEAEKLVNDYKNRKVK